MVACDLQELSSEPCLAAIFALPPLSKRTAAVCITFIGMLRGKRAGSC